MYVTKQRKKALVRNSSPKQNLALLSSVSQKTKRKEASLPPRKKTVVAQHNPLVHCIKTPKISKCY